MIERYRTVAGRVRTQTKVKASKFITTVTPVQSLEEVMSFLEGISKEFSDATHNVSAFKVGLGDQAIKRYNDDGEPAGSSGPALLLAIEGENLTNLAVVVTRYFGGIKLGYGGLIRAYSDAAKNGLKLAEIKEKAEYLVIRVTVPYDRVGAVFKEVQGGVGVITDTQYSNQGVAIFIDLLSAFLEKLTTRLKDATKGKAEIVILEKRFGG